MNKKILKELKEINKALEVIVGQHQSTLMLICLDVIIKHLINIENIAKHDNKKRFKEK